jgi:3-deoxy-manno-octulosonate cytidylyltransferase (CMP-KDO synthetase)
MNNIKIIFSDFDGVFTDGKRYMGINEEHIKCYNMKDGLAIKNIRSLGIKIIIISGDNSNVTKRICERLNFSDSDYYLGIKHKKSKLDQLLAEYNLNYNNAMYIGDDLNDIECLKSCKYKFIPNNCNEKLFSIKSITKLKSNGGEGCFSEIYNKLIESLNNNYCNFKKICFIPARYGSTRLEGKPLLKINGKTIINLVWEKVSNCKYIDDIIVLTDDERIYNEVIHFGGKCGIIKDECLNGTDRIIKYIQKNKNICDIVVNVQGDEPFINPENIDKCIENYLNKKNKFEDMVCSTLYYKYNSKEELKKRTNGKIVLDNNNNILYCSRNVIPGCKNNYFNKNYHYNGHIGVFVFDKKYLLNEYSKENTKNQLSEDIEWLKILEQGYKINAVLVDEYEIGVNTKEDYDFLINKYQII